MCTAGASGRGICLSTPHVRVRVRVRVRVHVRVRVRVHVRARVHVWVWVWVRVRRLRVRVHVCCFVFWRGVVLCLRVMIMIAFIILNSSSVPFKLIEGLCSNPVGFKISVLRSHLL